MEKYFDSLKEDVNKIYNYAQEARKKGYDPSYNVEIIRADDTAARVEGILSVIYPELLNANLKEFIRKFEKEYGKNDLRVSLKIAEAIANNEVLVINDIEKRADLAIRAAVAYLTLGVVTAPLEGISQVKIRKNDDGTNYLAIYYAGPIRSAGGTASAMSVLIADFVRRIVGLDSYKPTEEEINRYYTEVEDYYTRVAAKQYHPTKQEIELIIKNVPVEITGEPTEKIEVSNYKDLPRVETNKIRGGMCLILLDGLPLKAEKMLKFVKKYANDFGIEHWFWLEDFIALKKKIHAAVKIEDVAEEKPKYIPSTKYLDKLVGGRPVLSFPAAKGGFRLRYGKSFTNGLAGVNLSVGVFYLFDHLAMGTQVALEGPGKAAVVMPHNALENPIVLLNNGDVIEIKGEEDVKKYKNQIKEILYLGDILIPFGEFVSNNHVLLPAGYAEEWWLLELKQHNKQLYEKYKKFWVNYPDFNEAVMISEKYNIGLHPKYNLFWHDISKESLKILVKHLYNNLSYTKGELVLHYNTEIKQILEELGALHKVREERIILEDHYWIYDLFFRKYNDLETIYKIIDESPDVMEALMKISGLTIRKRAPTYLGLRMGRPEKAKIRKMKGSPQMLFPVGEEGGKRRNLMESYNHQKIKVQIITYKCLDCGKESYYKRCMHCGSLNTKYVMYCNGKPIFEEKECNSKPQLYAIRNIDIKWLTDKAYERVGMEKLDLVKGVRGVSGEKRAVELIEKGLLRAKHDLYVNKDGTIRFDATDIPLTHFRPRDIGVSVEKLRELGYTHDIYGNALESEDQILILKPQDIIIPENEDVSSAEVLLKTAQFLDELLVKVYGMEPYYNFKSKEDVIGALVVGLAPHTSAGIVGRVIGFGRAKGVLAHPYWHAAKRRNCLVGSEDVLLETKDGEVKVVKAKDFEHLNPRNYYALSVDAHGNIVKRRIKEFVKLKAKEKIYRIKTSYGREITVTHDHRMLVYNGKGWELKEAKDLKEGDVLLALNGFKRKGIDEINLLKVFSSNDVMIRGLKSLISYDSLPEKGKDVWQYWDRDSIPYNIVKSMNLDYNNLKVSFKYDRESIPVKLKLNYDLGMLVGLYLSDGYARTTKKKSNEKYVYQVSWSTNDKRVKEFIKSKIRDIFGKEVYEKKEGNTYVLVLSGRVYYELFSLFGRNAKDKRAYIALNYSEEFRKGLLSGMVVGDGSVSKDIRIVSVNKELINDLALIATSLGLFPSLRKEHRSTNFKENVVFYELRFYSSDVSFFQGLLIGDKAKRLVVDKVKAKRIKRFGKFALVKVEEIKAFDVDDATYVYDMVLEGEKTFIAGYGWLATYDCDGDEDSIMLLLDAFLNFSREYLPDTRGAKTMDVPLVLTTVLNPEEVDDESWNFEVVSEYPLKFYEATLQYKTLDELSKEEFPTIAEHKIRAGQPFDLYFTLEQEVMFDAPIHSKYVEIPDMAAKVKEQLEISRKIRAADENKVAEEIIKKHLLKDIKGNLRQFSRQKFRCIDCNEKYRRIPLAGKCTKCGGNIVLTVSEGSIRKYVDVIKDIITKYKISSYTIQNFKILEENIETMFGKKTRQKSLFG